MSDLSENTKRLIAILGEGHPIVLEIMDGGAPPEVEVWLSCFEVVLEKMAQQGLDVVMVMAAMVRQRDDEDQALVDSSLRTEAEYRLQD